MQSAPVRGEIGVQVFDLFMPRWPEPRPQELAPPRQLVIRLPAHAASLSGWWPLPDAVTWVTSWLTLRRDKPNRQAMARWLSGCPAVTDAAYAARTACSTSPGTSGTAGVAVTARGTRARRTCCMAISTEPMNATAGHAEISAPSRPYPR